MERLMQQSNGKPVMTNVPAAPLPVVVVVAGPVGLAAAAHLLERGLDPLVLEAGEVGAGVKGWAHVRVFSPWRHNLDAARSEEHTSELQSRPHLVCRLLLEKKNNEN